MKKDRPNQQAHVLGEQKKGGEINSVIKCRNNDVNPLE